MWNNHRTSTSLLAWTVLLYLTPFYMVVASSLTILEAHLSQHSVRGVLKFTQSAPGDPVTIHANLSVAREYKGEYSWGIYPFPIGKKYTYLYL